MTRLGTAVWSATTLDDLPGPLQLNFLVELLEPDHENSLFGLDLFEPAPVDLGRAVLVGLCLEVADQADDELVHDGPGLLFPDDVVQAFQIVPQGESELFQPKTTNLL